MANNYASVIEIVADQETNWRAVVIEAAKIAPSVIVKAAKIAKEGPWQAAVLPLARAGQKIEAIKLCRHLTGMGLKDAKEAVEKLQSAV